MKKLLLLFSLSLVLFYGCSKPPQPVYDQPIMMDSGYYEVAWVEPSIIFADSLMTMIKANRLDSFYVDQPTLPNTSSVFSLSFEVTYQPCYTRVRIINAQTDEYLTLYEGALSLGHYKITCNRSKINQPGWALRNLFLKADFCGATLIEPLQN